MSKSRARYLSELLNSTGEINATLGVALGDNDVATFGDSDDLKIYHNGSNSYIDDIGTGALNIRSSGIYLEKDNGAEVLLSAIADGAVTLYYDGSTKFATTTNGTLTTGHIQVSGTSNIYVNDDGKFIAGGGDDLQIYHDSSGNRGIVANHTGAFYIDQNQNDGNLVLRSDNGSGGVAEYVVLDGGSGAVVLKHYGNTKLATTSSGATITGTLVADGLDLGDSESVRLGASQDFQIYHDGSNSYIYDAGTGYMVLMSDGPGIRLNRASNADVMIDATPGGSSSLWYDGSKKFETTSYGADLTGRLVTTSHIDAPDSARVRLGDGDDLMFYHDGTNSYIVNQTNDLLLDLAGDIVIDADGGDFIFRDGGTNRMTIKVNDAANVDFIAQTSDHDIRFRGVDGSTTITALRLDMSIAGRAYFNAGASFNGNINANDNQNLILGTHDDFQIYHDGFNNYIDVSTGSLLIRNTNDNYHVIIQSDNGGGGLADYFRAKGDTGEAILYHYGNEKLKTSSSGATITGTITATGGELYLGAADSASAHINSYEVMTFNIDSDNDDAARYFGWFRNGNSGSGDALMRLTESGYLGIGTTDPYYKLDVYGTDDVTMRVHRPSSGLAATDTCGIGFSHRGDANTSTSDTRAGIFSTYNGTLFLATEPGGNLNSNPMDHAALTITGTGQNVGINTTTPYAGARMQICADDTSPSLNTTAIDDCTLILSNSDDDYGTVFATDGTGKGYIQQRRAATATYYDLSIQPYGSNVLVGTASAVVDSSNTNFNMVFPDNGGIAIGSAYTFANIYGNVGNLYLRANAYPANTGSDATIYLQTGNSAGGQAPDVVVKAGNVGINNTSPSSRLQVSGPASSSLPLVNITNTSNTTATSFGLSVQGGGDSGGDGYQFQTKDLSGNVDFFIRGDGNVGIGTTSPDWALDVRGYQTSVQLQIGRTDNNVGTTWMGSDSTGFHLGPGAYSGGGFNAGNPAFKVLATSGYVGIGTASPEAPLEIYKTVDGDSVGLLVMNQKSYGSGTGTNERSTIALGIAESGVASLNRKFGTIHVRPYNESDSSQGILSFGVRGGSAIRDDVLVLRGYSATDQRVGIGTTDPGSKLVIYEDDSAFGNTQLHIHNDKSDDAAVIRLEGKRTSSNDTGQIIFANNGNIGSSIRNYSGGDSGHLRFYTSASGTGNSVAERMSIDAYGQFAVRFNDTINALVIGGPNTVNGVTATPSNSGTVMALGRDTGSNRSAHFAGFLKFDSGYGIDFGSTSNASGMTSSVLDDYEEGTWTAGLRYDNATSGTAATLSEKSGSYTKVGRMVTVNAEIDVSSTNSGSGIVYITGLPFTVANILSPTGIEASGAIGYYTGFTSHVNSLTFGVENLTTYGFITCNTSGTQVNSSYLTAGIMGTGEFRLSITYFTT